MRHHPSGERYSQQKKVAVLARYRDAARKRQIQQVGLIATLSIACIVARLIYLQINLVHYLADRGQRNFTRIEAVHSPRGHILDRTGKPLAVSLVNAFVEPVELSVIADCNLPSSLEHSSECLNS